MDRTQKADAVAALNSALQKTNLVIVAQHNGLTVAEVTDLRGKIRAAGAGFKVTKNRLARIALKGTQFEGLDQFFRGPTAIAFASDPVAAAKVISDFAKSNDKLQIIGAGLGAQVLTADAVKALATLPSLDQLRAQIIGLLQAPATKVAGVLQAPGGQLARVLSAYAKKDEAEAA